MPDMDRFEDFYI